MERPCKNPTTSSFDRMVNYHKLNNLVWVWVTDRILGRARLVPPATPTWTSWDAIIITIPREANQCVPRRIVRKCENDFQRKEAHRALSENGSIPYPDSIFADGANWSYFMPWYGDYTMDGWAHDNTAADWKTVMNNDYADHPR